VTFDEWELEAAVVRDVDIMPRDPTENLPLSMLDICPAPLVNGCIAGGRHVADSLSACLGHAYHARQLCSLSSPLVGRGTCLGRAYAADGVAQKAPVASAPARSAHQKRHDHIGRDRRLHDVCLPLHPLLRRMSSACWKSGEIT
jgi:hypothetical protein